MGSDLSRQDAPLLLKAYQFDDDPPMSRTSIWDLLSVHWRAMTLLFDDILPNLIYLPLAEILFNRLLIFLHPGNMRRKRKFWFSTGPGFRPPILNNRVMRNP